MILSISKTYGAILLGSLAATFLSGMNTLLTVVYFRIYSMDTLLLKASVTIVWALDIIHTAFIWVAVWFYFIKNIGNIRAIDIMQTNELLPGTIVVTTIVTFIVHLFYLNRIFRLSHKNYWISTPIFILALARVGGAMATAAEMYRAKTFSGFGASRYRWVLSLGLAFTATTDVVIMLVLFALLSISRQRSLSLNNIIDRIILYTLEMGTLTGCIAVATMITWFTQKHTLIFVAVYLNLSKLYAISFMGSLDTRHHIPRENGSQGSQPWQLSRNARMPLTSSGAAAEIQLQHVHVDVTKSVQYDDKGPDY